jgi:hypothetical protein
MTVNSNELNLIMHKLMDHLKNTPSFQDLGKANVIYWKESEEEKQVYLTKNLFTYPANSV